MEKSEQKSVKGNGLSINNSLLIIVALLIAMSAVQMFQFQKLTKAMESGVIKTSTQSVGRTTTTGGSVKLPSQVGGCG